MNEYINLDEKNIDDEHICCAIGDPKHQNGVDKKKEWIKSKLSDGHVFRKLNARGKIFIEYEPIETAWTPVIGKNYMHIYCLWVAGSFKGKGIAKELLEYAINDAKTKKMSGLCTIVTEKKKPFIGDKKFFEHFGFKVVDTINDYQLMVLSFDDKETPKFSDTARRMEIDNQDFTIYYSNECPYVEYEVKELTDYAKDKCIKLNFIKIDSLEKAKKMSGLCTIVTEKKKPFIGDKKFFEHFGFKVVDTINDYQLMVLSFDDKETPKFSDTARRMEIDNQDFTIYYSNECPYVEYEVKELSDYAKDKGIKLNFIKIDSLEKAKNAPCIFNNWANFYKGKFISNTILNANAFAKLLK